MKFKLSKNIFLIVLFFLANIVVSCKKEEDKDSSAYEDKVIPSASYIISGKIEKVYQINSMNADEIRVYGEKNYLLATCSISSDGQFRVALPIPPSDYLDSVNKGTPPTGLNISNKAAKGVKIKLIAYKKGQEVGAVEKLKTEENVVYQNQYIYIDSNNILTGGYSLTENDIEYEFIYNENLKKGWNLVLTTMSKEKNNENKIITQYETDKKEPGGMTWVIW